MTKTFLAAVAAALAVLSASASLAQTAPTMHKSGKHTMGKHTMAVKPIYVCKDCHQYFTPAQAKKLGYKDPDGGKLVKASRVPTGYTPGLMTKS